MVVQYNYPSDCITPDQRSKYRKQQRKQFGTLAQRGIVSASPGSSYLDVSQPKRSEGSFQRKTNEQLFGTYTQIIDGERTKCRGCNFPIKDLKTAERYNGYLYHHTCTPGYERTMPESLRPDYKWTEVPLRHRELGLRLGWTADQMGESLKGFGKPDCGECGEAMYPWDNQAEVAIEGQHVIVHDGCIPEGAEIA